MNIPTIAGVVGTADEHPGLIGTSNALMGIYGFSSGNAGIVGETANPNSFAGFFQGNVRRCRESIAWPPLSTDIGALQGYA